MKLFDEQAVAAALAGAEFEVLHAVQRAYLLHGEGETAVPFPATLQPWTDRPNRFVARPAYLGGKTPIAGLTWLSSGPGRTSHSAGPGDTSLLVLNDVATGRAVAVLAAGQIVLWRTAASAALASHLLHDADPVSAVGLVGCTPLNLDTCAFLAVVHPDLRLVVLYDDIRQRSAEAAAVLAGRLPGLTIVVSPTLDDVLATETVSIDTDRSTPWLDLSSYPARPAEQVLLHLSLRDLTVASVASAYNVVDDLEHLLTTESSLRTAQQVLGREDLVHATIGALIGRPERAVGSWPTKVFTPVGLTICDLAVAAQVLHAPDA